MRAFIYSLPRSGSAWLSVFLTGRNSFCFHEPSVESMTLEHLFSSRPEPSVCAVDTAAYRDNPAAGRDLKAKCFALLRDPEEITASLLRAGLISANYCLEREVELFNAATFGMKKILHSQLNDEQYREWIFESVTGQTYDRQRSRAIADMNIQRDLRKFFA